MDVQPDDSLEYYRKAVKLAQKNVDRQTKVVEEKQEAYDDWLEEQQEGDDYFINAELSEDVQKMSREYKELREAKNLLESHKLALDISKEALEFAEKRNTLALEAVKDPNDTSEKEGSATTPIIVSITAIILIGGGCFYYRKNKSEAEGGEKEDKKLFKKVFSGKVQKKAAKEEIIPTSTVSTVEF